MKRKRGNVNLSGETIFALPNTESTFCIEVEQNKVGKVGSGGNDFLEIGEIKSVELSHSISTNIQKMMYNHFFWGDELFTFNYLNGGVGVAVAYLYRNPNIGNISKSNFSFAIFPIFLPRITLSTLQSCFSSNITGRPLAILLLKSLAYYLNVGFSNINVANTGVGTEKYPQFFFGMGNNTTVPDYYYLPQWMAAKNAKGPCYNRDSSPPTIFTYNCKQMPIFQDAEAPPLLWIVDEANLKLGLQINPNFSKFSSNSIENQCYIGVQLVSLEKYFCDATKIAVANDPFYVNADIFYKYFSGQNEANVTVLSPYSEEAGWFNNGVFALGFGYSSSKYNSQTGNLEKTAGQYGDLYTDAERQDLWNQTIFPDSNNDGMTPYLFASFCEKYKLVHNVWGGGGRTIFSNFSPWFVPTRFLCIKSNALSITQKRPAMSNNPSVSPNTIGLYFLSFNDKRRWKDDTVAGSKNATKFHPGGNAFSKSVVNDSIVLTSDIRRAIQSFDLIIDDEWQNTLQNFGYVNHSIPQISAMVFYKFFEWEGMVPNKFLYPSWLINLYPYAPFIPGITTYSSMLVDENWYSSCYMFMSIRSSSEQSVVVLGDNFNPQMLSGANMIHFSRVLGF